jgi:hypothetical protein
LAGKNAWKRLTEDLPALLAAMGHEVGETVDLKVKDLATKEIRELPRGEDDEGESAALVASESQCAGARDRGRGRCREP